MDSRKLVYSTAEVAEALQMNEHKIGQLRKHGALKAIRKGNGYIFTAKEIERFLDLYNGADLSNEFQIRNAVKERTA